jgi:hypothetical protein
LPRDTSLSSSMMDSGMSVLLMSPSSNPMFSPNRNWHRLIPSAQGLEREYIEASAENHFSSRASWNSLTSELWQFTH